MPTNRLSEQKSSESFSLINGIMDELSSGGSCDEEEVLKNFELEANLIVQKDTLPAKSADRYILVYQAYKKWKEDNAKLLSPNEECNLIVYFNNLKSRVAPTTLWSVWSMLRNTLKNKDDINISNFLSLKSIIKNQNKGYKPKKACVLKWPQIMNFLSDAQDNIYLARKVILIFGICGCMRCDEITNLTIDNVEDIGGRYLVSIIDNKNNYSGQFIVGNLFYAKVKDYISLRPPNVSTNRFFIKYNDGRCYSQPIGVHKIGEVPYDVATYLQLDNPKRFTGHCFRRTAATLLSDAGANLVMIKQFGRWRSDAIALGYIENSLHNRQLIYNNLTSLITPQANTSNSVVSFANASVVPFGSLSASNAQPSTSKQQSTSYVPTNNSISLNELDIINPEDFMDNFELDNAKQNQNEKIDFVSANKKEITVSNKTVTKGSFQHKTPITLKFKNKNSDDQNSEETCLRNKKAKVTEKNPPDENIITDENDNSVHPKFINCTFNNIAFHNCTFY